MLSVFLSSLQFVLFPVLAAYFEFASDYKLWGSYCRVCSIMCLYFHCSVLLFLLRLLHKAMFGSILHPVVCGRANVLFVLYVLLLIRCSNCLPLGSTWVHSLSVLFILCGYMCCVKLNLSINIDVPYQYVCVAPDKCKYIQ